MPQPLGFYSLEASDQIEKELSALDYLELWDLVLVLSLFHFDNEPSNESYSVETFKWLITLTSEHRCKLLRWIGDRMEKFI